LCQFEQGSSTYFYVYMYHVQLRSKEEELLKKTFVSVTGSALMLFALTFFTWGSTASAATVKQSGHSGFARACASAPVGYASCLALVSKIHVYAHSTGGNPPYSPSDLHNAYNLPTTASGTPLVAVVDAYNNPNLASDLATYRSTFGLPACSESSGCLSIVNETGGSKLPGNDVGWGLEESLDLDMVSAICQNCHIVLVEATTNGNKDLGLAVDEAVKLGAVAVSNSYGENEFSTENSPCTKNYTHPYVAITASTGDSGPGVSYPAICKTVIGVGGTTLNSNGQETAWSGAGGGCSAYVLKPAYQVQSVTTCSNHAVADVSADADPNTGVYVYDSYGYGGGVQVGGTSVSSPIIASVFALAGNTATAKHDGKLIWSSRSKGCLFQVGSSQYAYQTGLGSPNGTSCF
jgi:subtilase family serine protease